MDTHKFTCSNGHIFFVPLHLPQSISAIAPVLKSLRCPICQDRQVSLEFKSYRVK